MRFSPGGGARNPADILDRLRIGSVRYLNARPLIAPYAGPVRLEHPSVLAAALVRGELDVALVPVFEALRSPEFLMVDGVSISSQGPVWSVFVAHRGPRSGIREIVLDPASLTSAHLCKVVFAEWREREPRYLSEPASPLSSDAARLLIGNQAIAFREKHGAEYEYLDLGEEWRLRTGLPFVFAVWLLRPETPCAGEVAGAFRAMARQGREHVREIAAQHPEYPLEFALRYLTEHIRFGLGEAEKQGMARFRELLLKHGLLAEAPMPFRFV